MDMSKVFRSSLGIQYPSFRDHPLHSVEKWLEGKNIDDGAEGYWRIHDHLYDLSGFIESHPGGKDWIQLTKGTDITEAFESHHLSANAERLLPRFLLGKASSPRRFPFTFHEDGFYKTLKRRIMKQMENLPKKPADRSKSIIDGIFSGYLASFLLAVYFESFAIGALSGIFLGLLTVAAHNFFHQKDNFRRFYFDFSMMGTRNWRVSHVLSHHMYTNTVCDMEISSVEPFLQYLPGEKGLLVRYGSWVYSFGFYAFLFLASYLKTLAAISLKGNFQLIWPALLPFIIPFLSWIITGKPVAICLLMYVWIIVIASIHFGLVGLNAAHHHPDIFHDGDAARPKQQMDWGLFQMDTVADRRDITGSHFLVLTNFGDHALHHLFPTVDHGHLEQLYPVFLETCEEFGVKWKFLTQLDLIKGQYEQLARILPNQNPPN